MTVPRGVSSVLSPALRFICESLKSLIIFQSVNRNIIGAAQPSHQRYCGIAVSNFNVAVNAGIESEQWGIHRSTERRRASEERMIAGR